MPIEPLGTKSALNQLGEINRQQEINQRRLASGLRVGRAADDAAAMAIAERIGSQIRGFGAATQDVQIGIGAVLTAEGGMAEASNVLQRMRELGVQANSSLLSDADRGAIQSEMDQLKGQLNQIAGNTQFNGQPLLNGDLTTNPLTVPAGPSGETQQAELPDVSAAALGVSGASVSTQANAQSAIQAIDTALGTVSEGRAKAGAAQNAFEATLRNMDVASVNLEAGRSRIRDADMAAEAARRAALQIRQEAATGILAQGNLNAKMVSRLISG